MNDFVDNETKPNICIEEQSLQMSQILRAGFSDASDREGALNHFNHRHPLLRLHLRESEGIKCSFCYIVISGRGYACNQHCDYYLHDVCFSFPREIRHDFHPGSDHTLILRPFRSTESSFIVLRVDMTILFILCSSHTMAVSPVYLYHKVKYPLHLFLSFPIIRETATLFCSICAKLVPTSGCWLFYNHEHDYLCHFNCAAVAEYGTENHSMGKLQNRLQSLATTNRPPTTLAGQSSGNVTHFSHRHALKEYNSDMPLTCSLCGIDYLTGYFCCNCNYFIDKICFSVPSMIQHMSHPQHPPKLTCYLDFKNENVKCPGCQGILKNERAGPTIAPHANLL